MRLPWQTADDIVDDCVPGEHLERVRPRHAILCEGDHWLDVLDPCIGLGVRDELRVVNRRDTIARYTESRAPRRKHATDASGIGRLRITDAMQRRYGRCASRATEHAGNLVQHRYLVHSIGSSENEEVPHIIRERTQPGLASARARGWMGGRPKKKKLNTPAKVAIAKALDADHSHSITDICKTVGSRATLYRCLDVPAPLAAAPTEP